MIRSIHESADCFSEAPRPDEIPNHQVPLAAPGASHEQVVGRNLRILVIDDNRAIHDDFRKILSHSVEEDGLAGAEAALFCDTAPSVSLTRYEVDSVGQGQEGLERVMQSHNAGLPYALAFVDMRMPPGWDGLETIARIWAVDADIQTVICTAYSDYSWEDIIERLGFSDRLLILKKPFANIEVLQLANALTEKWRLLQQAKSKIRGLEEKVLEHQENEERSRRALQREHELHMIKSRFVTMVSHEFRTPLSVVNISADMLGRYHDRLTGGERAAHIDDIQGAVTRMTEMMEDFLIHGGFENGKMECKPSRVDMETICRRLIGESASGPAAGRSIEYSIEPAAREAFLDQKILRHVLGNLLSNAIKYSTDGQSVSLEVKCVAGDAQASEGTDTPSGDQIQLTVRDSGIGIPSGEMSKLFQTFHRASNVGQRPGTGMGLAIVKQCVDLHRGTIRVTSEEGKGTTFSVCLPNVPPAPAGKLPPTLAPELAEVIETIS